MCRGEWGAEVDSGHVWRHGGVPDIGVMLISNPDPCLSCSFGVSGGLEQQGRSHSFADKQGLENTGEGRSALDCVSAGAGVQSAFTGRAQCLARLPSLQIPAASWGLPRVSPHL